MRRSATILITDVLLATLLSLSAADAQSVGGVELGQTPLSRMTAIRGVPKESGPLNDGAGYFVAYDGWTYYFSRDSIAIGVRFFPLQQTRAELERMIGPPRRLSTDSDHTIIAAYSDTVTVRLSRDGQRVIYIEYLHEGAPSGTKKGSPPSPNGRGGISSWDAMPADLLERFLSPYYERMVGILWESCIDGPHQGVLDLMRDARRHKTSITDSLATLMVLDSITARPEPACKAVGRLRMSIHSSPK